MEPTPILGDSCAAQKSPAMIRSMKGNHMAALSVPCGGLLKFLVLFGYLTLEDSQQAVAGTDFASGLQSTLHLGDLGDISTGFASVRKISLYLM
uniref:Uncharacterized protein n=1 Tax=Rhizophora mucronata TaxID=61149 RepID=A0A2P2LLW9_RHIMU